MAQMKEKKMYSGKRAATAYLLSILMAAVFLLAGCAAGNAKSTADDDSDMTITVIEPETERYNGYGDIAMLQSGGQSLLMDTYVADAWSDVRRELLNNGFTKFDIYLSHYHDDHYGNILNILNDDAFTVSRLYLPEADYLTLTPQTDADYVDRIHTFVHDYTDILEAARRKGVFVTYLRKGSSFHVGSASLHVLWGCTYKNSNHDTIYINNNSLVTMVSAGGIKFLTAGDIRRETETEIVRRGIDISADIFKLSHHSSKSSNNVYFLNAVDPIYTYSDANTDTSDTYNWNKGIAKQSIARAGRLSNVYSTRYNGQLTFLCQKGMISVTALRHTKGKEIQYRNAQGDMIGRTEVQLNSAQTKDFLDARLGREISGESEVRIRIENAPRLDDDPDAKPEIEWYGDGDGK